MGREGDLLTKLPRLALFEKWKGNHHPLAQDYFYAGERDLIEGYVSSAKEMLMDCVRRAPKRFLVRAGAVAELRALSRSP